jgi:hypothetical protein
MNWQLESPALAYVGFVLGLVASLTGIFGWFPAEIAWSIAGLFGFGGIAALRAFIESSGWTTYAYVGLQIINTVCFMILNLYDLLVFQTLMGLIASLTGIGLSNGYKKSIAPSG